MLEIECNPEEVESLRKQLLDPKYHITELTPALIVAMQQEFGLSDERTAMLWDMYNKVLDLENREAELEKVS